jgi:hypothetical protein
MPLRQEYYELSAWGKVRVIVLALLGLAAIAGFGLAAIKVELALRLIIVPAWFLILWWVSRHQLVAEVLWTKLAPLAVLAGLIYLFLTDQLKLPW